MIEEELYTLLNTNSVTTYVGTRIYPGLAPQGAAFPYIEYHRIITDRVRHLGGLSSLASPRFQINCWSSGYDEAKSLGEAVENRPDNYTGTPSAINIRRIYLEDKGDELEPAVGNESKRLYGRRLDFTIWHADT